MPLTIACPGCMKQFVVGSEFGGKTARCQRCGQVFAVPIVAPRSVPAPGRADSFDRTGIREPSESGTSPAAGALSTRSASASGPQSVEPINPKAIFEVDEGDDAAYASAALPPAYSSWRRRSGSAPWRPILIVVGLLAGVGAGIAGLVWLGGTITARLGGGEAVASNPNGSGSGLASWPSLPAPDYPLYPAGTSPAARPAGSVRSDVVDRTVSLIRRLMRQLNQIADALASIHNPASAQAAVTTMQQLHPQIEATINAGRALPRPNTSESREIAEQVQDEMRKSMDRLREETVRLGNMPGGSVAARRMMPGINEMAAGFEREFVQPPMARSVPQPYVEVYIAVVPDSDTSSLLVEKLVEIAPKLGFQVNWGGSYQATSVRLWPVANAREFASRIPFGKGEVFGHRIVVRDPLINPQEVSNYKLRLANERTQREAEAAAREQEAAARREADGPSPPAGADGITRALYKLRSTSGFKVKEGLTELGRMMPVEERSAEVVQAVIPAATGADHFHAIEAIKVLANWKNAEATKALMRVVETSDDVFIRREAMRQLARLEEPAAADLIAGRLDVDWPEAGTALKSMGELAEPALIKLLRNPDARVRGQACELLFELGGQAALEAMLSLPADPDTMVQMKATEAMKAISNRIGPDATAAARSNARASRKGN